MKIGLTGGIGCGKSTVVGFFREAGWRTLEADAIVRELLADDTALQGRLRARWGEAVFDRSGAVDRKAIAAKVFKDTTELDWLESQLHPMVRARWSAALSEAGNAPCLVEIPLLFEKRLETEFDLTVCVACPYNLVEKRMVARGYTSAEIAQRYKRQMPLETKTELADHLISNAGSLEFLKRQTMRLIEPITRS
ncbi:MAG: dephospho-CoA kinase [Puniceicoccaceae bacterium]|nr:MAG: dephospho-CoA kinase [Puniceicoccaceae bacterium]